MQVDLHNALREPQSLEATRVLVRDKYGNPLVFVIEDGEMVNFKTIDDPDFQQALKDFGINRTIIVKQLDVSPK